MTPFVLIRPTSSALCPAADPRMARPLSPPSSMCPRKMRKRMSPSSSGSLYIPASARRKRPSPRPSRAAPAAADGRENIHLVDSGSAAIGAGILAELALQLADEGMDAAEIAERLREERKNIRVIALLDTLEYLKRGGRISRTVAFAGSMLAIKPVASIVDGEIKLLGKARGSKQGNNLLVSEIEKSGGIDFSRPILLGYTGLSDYMLQKYIIDSAALWQYAADELAITAIGSVVGTHAGPGAIAAAFFHK